MLEDDKNQIIQKGRQTRDQLMQLLTEAFNVRVNVIKPLNRHELHTLEKKVREIQPTIIAFDDEASSLLSLITSARKIATPDGQTHPITLNEQFVFAIYSSQIVSARDMVRSANSELNGYVNNLRASHNNQVTILIALFSLVVSVLGIIDKKALSIWVVFVIVYLCLVSYVTKPKVKPVDKRAA